MTTTPQPPCIDAKHTSQIVGIPIGPGLLSHVVDALGNSIDSKGPIEAIECSSAR